MYLTFRAAIVRNIVVAGINCVVTLTLLLIAPLGLAAVISNTVMVTLSTLLVCTLGDVVVMWLSRGGQPPGTLPNSMQPPGSPMQPYQSRQDIERRD